MLMTIPAMCPLYGYSYKAVYAAGHPGSSSKAGLGQWVRAGLAPLAGVRTLADIKEESAP